jgi:hypothetical protein
LFTIVSLLEMSLLRLRCVAAGLELIWVRIPVPIPGMPPGVSI